MFGIRGEAVTRRVRRSDPYPPMDDELVCAKCNKAEEELMGDSVLKYTPCGHRLYAAPGG